MGEKKPPWIGSLYASDDWTSSPRKAENLLLLFDTCERYPLPSSLPLLIAIFHFPPTFFFFVSGSFPLATLPDTGTGKSSALGRRPVRCREYIQTAAGVLLTFSLLFDISSLPAPFNPPPLFGCCP